MQIDHDRGGNPRAMLVSVSPARAPGPNGKHFTVFIPIDEILKLRHTDRDLAGHPWLDVPGEEIIGLNISRAEHILCIHRPNNLTGGGLHPTQKPVALLQYLIRTYTNPNDLILDNTMGSGTTLLAAQNEGRRAVGIEISEEYCKIAIERLRQPSFFSIPDKPKIEQPKQLSLNDV